MCGISRPVITPARVACTPDFSTQAHSTTPSSRYGASALTFIRLSNAIAATTAAAAANAGHHSPCV
jgi:hypothetical protein